MTLLLDQHGTPDAQIVPQYLQSLLYVDLTLKLDACAA